MRIFEHPYLSIGVKPNREEMARVLARGQQMRFNYRHVGKTREYPEKNEVGPFWVWTQTKIEIGEGPECYQKGKAFMEKWGQFQHSWAEVDQNTPIKPGAGVGVAAGLEVGGFGAWSLMPLEVLYKEEKPHGDQKKGKAFRYGSGCLEGHWFEGEERFSLEWEGGKDGVVTFEVLSFSRPAGPLAVACYPVNRLLQLRFGRAAVNAVKKAVEQGSESSLRSRTLA